MLVPVIKDLLGLSVASALIVGRHLGKLEACRDRLPLEMARSSVGIDGVARQLLPIVFALWRVAHCSSYEL